MIQFEIDFKGQPKLQKTLKKVQVQLKNMSKQLSLAGIYMQKSIWKTFAAEGRPNKWAPLSAWTLSERHSKGYTGKILQQTGRLRNSISYDVSSTQVEVGTNVSYAEILQNGGTNKSGRFVPPRPFIMFQSRDENEIMDIWRRTIDI